MRGGSAGGGLAAAAGALDGSGGVCLGGTFGEAVLAGRDGDAVLPAEAPAPAPAGLPAPSPRLTGGFGK